MRSYSEKELGQRIDERGLSPAPEELVVALDKGTSVRARHLGLLSAHFSSGQVVSLNDDGTLVCDSIRNSLMSITLRVAHSNDPFCY